MVKKEGLKKERKINWVKTAAILGGMMVVINLILITDIRITFPSFRKTAYFGEILENTEKFQIKFLDVSPLYFTELTLKAPESINPKSNLKLSIKVKEKGKKFVENPEFRIFIVDSIGYLRSVFPPNISELIKENSNNLLEIKDDIERENIKKKIRFSFKMPPEDQKVLGRWKIFAYLYDCDNEDLVSYVICEFDVNENAKFGLIEYIIVFFAILMLVVAITATLETFLGDKIKEIGKKKK